MAHVLTNDHSFSLTAPFRALVDSVKVARARRAAFNRAYADLQTLSDRELLEYGLHRSDLMDLARDAIR